MAYGTVNADVIGTSVAGSNLGAGDASLMKNRIINGAMVIDQRNAGASVTPTNFQYTVDRWAGYLSQTSKFTVQQNAGSVTPPVGFSNYLGCTSSSAYSLTSTQVFGVAQAIEGFNTADLNWGTANAKTVTLSFWVRSSLTGTFGGSLANYNADRSYPFSYTISSANTWTYVSATITGCLDGTWGTGNSASIYVYISLGAGSTMSGTAGSWASADYRSATGATSVVGTSGATFYITGVQLEVGSSATGYEYVNYQTSLANCQRYFEKQSSAGGFNALGGNVYFNSSTLARVFLNYTWKRAIPTITFSGANTLAVISAPGNLAVTNYSGGNQNYNQSWVDLTVSGGTTGQAGFTTDYNTTASISYSAEL